MHSGDISGIYLSPVLKQCRTGLSHSHGSEPAKRIASHRIHTNAPSSPHPTLNPVTSRAYGVECIFTRTLDPEFVLLQKTDSYEASYGSDSASVLRNARDKPLPRTAPFSPEEPSGSVAAILYSAVIF